MPLISSPRHRNEDLDLWRDLEAADLVRARRLLVSGKVKRSKQAIADFLEKNGKAYVAVSWGKDSVVTAHLAREVAPVIPLMHLRPCNHNPDVDRVRDFYLEHFPGQAYHEEIVDYGGIHAAGLSNVEQDKATDIVWYAAIERVHEALGTGGKHISGVRADESPGRRLRCRKHGMNTVNTCAPLAWWNNEEVFAYLAHHRLPVHPAYACLGGGRWPRECIRVAEIGDIGGSNGGRRQWEKEYYGEELRLTMCNR
jgi:phosphoadenosine phosphosulfate reductase